MTTKPTFLLSRPEPSLKTRLYNGRKINVWEGKTKVASVQGWVDNPRIELEKKKYLSRVGPHELTQDEIFDLMKNDPEVKLKELRDDILKNGLREPLALAFDGRLLDGNRRFFAVKFALEGLPITSPNRQDLEVLDVHVLCDGASEEDEQNVLVEENFSASLKIEWPAYVKSKIVIQARDEGLSPDQIVQKFSWTKTKIREAIKIDEIIKDFMIFATTDVDPDDLSGRGLGLSEQAAETMVAKQYQYFNEAQKSFFDALKTDIEFKLQFFRWIAQEKFSSFPEVRIAHKAWEHPQAKAALLQPNPAAAKSAKAILDYDSRIVGSAAEAITRIESFVKFLKTMTATDLKTIPVPSRAQLEDALELVVRLSKAAAEVSP